MIKISERFVEPFGHTALSTKLERIWEQRLPGTAIHRARVQSFDFLGGMSFAPMEYWYEPINYTDAISPVTEGWIDSAFLGFVKGEFSSTHDRPVLHSIPTVDSIEYAPQDTYERYMLSCERQMLYSYHRLEAKHTDDNIFENFRRLLVDKGLGNPKNQHNAPFELLKPLMEKWAQEEARLLCILPSFPFKDQNFLRTHSANPSQYDLGEIALLMRLHLLSLAFYQFHPWGVDWLIAADGNFYADMFGIKPSDAEAYFRRIRGERNNLNLSGTVSILDLSEIVKHYASNCTDEFQRDREIISARLKQIATLEDGELATAFSVLKRGMRQNQSTRHFEGDVTNDELWKICMWENLDGDEKNLVKELHDVVGKDASTIAINYACENLLLKKHDVLNKVFPNSLRTTVHPKQGQIAVPQIGTCFPWNGVAFLPKPEDISVKSLEVRRFSDLGRKHQSLTAHVDAQTGSTLFFSPADQG